MKQYKVTVNGQSYDVSVEEVGATPAAPRAAAPTAAPAPAAPAASPAAPAAAPAAAAQFAPTAGAMSIKSPMPGTVLSFKVQAGQQVNRGDVLLILEAMKMENEIVATQSGKVVNLCVSAGSSVNTGDPLVELA